MDLLYGLNPHEARAVEAPDGPVLGAGRPRFGQDARKVQHLA